MHALAKIDRARADLAEARTLDEVKVIRDKAEAMRTYTKAAKLGREAQNHAAEIALLAARKAGEILAQLERKQGARTDQLPDKVSGSSEYRQALKDTGTHEKTAQRWQKLADVPEATVQEYVAAIRKTQRGEITAGGLLRVAEKGARTKNRTTVFRKAAPTWGRPYYQKNGITLYCGDCREILPNISGDLLWTDPPYNVAKDYGDTWNDDLPPAEYLEFVTTWTALAKASCPGVAVYVPPKWMLEYWQALGNDYRQVVLSYSASGALRYGWSNQFSSILTNAQPLEVTPNVWHNLQMPGLGFFFRENDYGHPGYTSEDVTRRVLSCLCPDGGTVIDPFCGTGTTLRIAQDAGLSAIGIEVNEKYCEVAVNRLVTEQAAA